MEDPDNNPERIRFRDIMRDSKGSPKQEPQKQDGRDHGRSIGSPVPQPKVEDPIKPQSAVKKRILVIDDEPNFRNLSVNWLRNYEVVAVESAREGLELLGSERFSLAMIDAHAKDMDGISFTAAAKGAVKNIPVILLNSLGSPSWSDIEKLPQETRPDAMIGRSYYDFDLNHIEEIIKKGERGRESQPSTGQFDKNQT